MNKRFFRKAYGLDNTPRQKHSDVIAEACHITGCSERAIHELLYGHSYDTDTELKALREQVPGYPQKLPQRYRAAELKFIIDNPEEHPFLSFDGNAKADAQTAVEPAKKEASGLMASVMRLFRASAQVC